ncbi:general transcription and DNA repair factor IIH subunit Tfb5p [[Candida] anglica]|uniref:General transcription and DNA repair factor IIH subunit TFB5 n=1 Tax=[Candida] anglica TaxID=148631 RepID=A0ABP0E7G6_9ASCO
MPRAIRGVLVRCDPSIKALILKIDSARHDIVIEELDDTHLVIDQKQVQAVKNELNRLLSKNIYNPFEEQ